MQCIRVNRAPAPPASQIESSTSTGNKSLLDLKSTLGELTLYATYIEASHSGTEAIKVFEANPLLPGIIITDQGQFVGMISRQRFYEYMSRPYSLGLFSQRPLLVLYQLIRPNILILDSNTSILAAVRQSLERVTEWLYEPIVVSVADTYKLIDLHEILLAQLRIQEMTTDALQQSEAQLKEQANQLWQALHELQHSQAQLIQTEKMSGLGQMVAGIAHEINNPVSFIYGNLAHAVQYTQDLLHLLDLYQQHYPQAVSEIRDNAENIDIDFLKEDLPKLLSSMQIGADRIQQLVLSMRNFSRMDQSEMKRVDIHEGIDNTLLLLQHRLKQRRKEPIQIIKKYGELPLVDCYAGQLNQVFMNILTNAIDAFDDHSNQQILADRQNNPSVIQIHTQVVNKDQVMIRIIDNGMGMTEEVKQQLFEPFFTTKAIGKGTGLGLSICYQIIAKHRGQLKCVSAPGRGAEFLIEIPIRQQ